MRLTWKKLIQWLSSLKLTILCLSAAMVLVFVGTIVQVNLGLQLVQEHFFRSLIVWWPIQPHGMRFPIFPGGHLIGAVLLLNLVVALASRFEWSWRKSGHYLTHGGLIVMLVGALLTDMLSVESSMRLSQGETKNYQEDTLRTELAIVDETDTEFDQVTTIPLEQLRQGRTISDPILPFRVAVRRVLPNSRLQMLSQAGPGAIPAAMQGHGAQIAILAAPRATALNERNLASAVVEILPTATAAGKPGDSLGTWLVSDALGTPQTFPCAGKTWSIALRPVRHYKPYSITLKKFTHERYPGTEIPKNFSSDVFLSDPENGTSRDALIYMNHPLRYRGDTFYQSGFDDDDTTSILQVVHNPAMVTPYLGCIMVGLGLLIQFSYHLVGFSRRTRTETAS